MAVLKNFLQDLRRLNVLLPARRTVSLAQMPPTVSFSFDDFPVSAAHQGARILEDHGFRGTYYLAAGLLGTATEHGAMASVDDIGRLAANGHEIGCHTHGHLRAGQVGVEAYAQDLEQNGRAVAQLLGGLEMTSFAFPYGSVTPGAKRAAARRFSSCRTTMPRVNRGLTDLNLLSAVPVYAREGYTERAKDFLTDCGRRGGWLIVYTHDVQVDHSPCGCTPQQFEEFVRAVVRQGCAVAPVRDVVARATAASGRMSPGSPHQIRAAAKTHVAP